MKYFVDAEQRVYEEHRRNSRPPLKLAQAYEFVAYAEQRMVCAKTLCNYIDQHC